MRSTFRRLVVHSSVLAVLLSAALAQTVPSYRELPNFHKVADHLYRGAQPLNGGVKKLAELGIKSIVNLRGEDEISRSEEKEAKAAGLNYFSLPMPGLSAPTNEQVTKALAIIDDPGNQPVFIHCKRGSDRTGTIVALYRISHEGWNADQANSEARKFGMSWMEFGMRSYITDYYNRQSQSRRSQQQPAAAVSK